MDTQKILLIVAFLFTSMMLWSSWEQHKHPEKYVNTIQSENINTTNIETITSTNEVPANKDISENEKPGLPENNINSVKIDEKPIDNTDLITITTDVLQISIDPRGANIVNAQLLTYPVDVNHNKNPVVLMGNDNNRFLIAQTGVLSHLDKQYTPDHNAVFKTAQTSYELNQENQLEVHFDWQSNDQKVVLRKTFIFKKGHYDITLQQTLENKLSTNYKGYFYRQLQRNDDANESMFIHTYTGGMSYRDDGGFEKYSFDDMQDEAINKRIKGGWIAFIEHYFLVSWIPNADQMDQYYSRVINTANEGKRYILGLTSDSFDITSGQTYTQQDKLFIGPKLQKELKELSPNLNDTVDFGFLSVIGHLIFWLLVNIYDLVGNWGWAIIFLTLVIKLIFYKLSAYSYRSMAQLRKLTPKLKALQEQHKDNAQARNEALMKMYKQEKVNPLGGCLPILVQIPVFIALYWVLLESVELRQADFMLWLNNLSAPDPFYVLPLIMGATMFIQQKLNPAPTDPVQEKIMQMLPFIFTVFFAFFPSGLVLYWVTNNILSIAQQWYITRQLS